MPFYTFKCPKCEKEKEVLQKNDSPPHCEECTTVVPKRVVKMVRQWKAPAKAQFKCGGFYATDYKGRSKLEQALGESEEEINKDRKK